MLNRYLRIFINYMCFSSEKVYKKIEATAKKCLCIWPLVSLLLRRICQLDGTWGTLYPPNSLYWDCPLHTLLMRKDTPFTLNGPSFNFTSFMKVAYQYTLVFKVASDKIFQNSYGY